MGLTEWSTQIHEANKAKGFYEKYEAIKDILSERESAEHLKEFLDEVFGAQRYALIASEVSEALESIRSSRVPKQADLQEFERLLTLNFIEGDDQGNEQKFKYFFETLIKDTEADENADSIIRILDNCGWKNIDIQKHIEYKLKYNSLRSKNHGKKF